MIKPRIYRHFYAPGNGHRNAMSIYRCIGSGLAGYGNSPSASYISWRVQYDAEQSRKSKPAEKFSPAR
jgi:hypothetical protein